MLKIPKRSLFQGSRLSNHDRQSYLETACMRRSNSHEDYLRMYDYVKEQLGMSGRNGPYSKFDWERRVDYTINDYEEMRIPEYEDISESEGDYILPKW